jgi:predicted RNase H-like HicB family nuclease
LEKTDYSYFIMQRKFNVVIERDSEGWLVASVPSLPGCHTQARSFDELDLRIKEAIALCLEDSDESLMSEFVGVQQVAVEC